MSNIEDLIASLNNFVQEIKRTSTSPAQSTDANASKTFNQYQALTFETFDESVEVFDNYAQRLDNFLKLNGLTGDDAETESRKVLVLINCLGPKHYQLLSNLTSPDLPATKSYAELMQLLKEHLSPRTNVLTEQHKFLSRAQRNGESISTYINALKELSKLADFKSTCQDLNCKKSVINLLLRAQFIRGLQDSEIREKILQQGELTFEKGVDIALTIEAAKIENKEVYKTNSTNQLNKISTNTKQNKSNIQRSRVVNKNISPNSRSSSRNRRVNFKELGIDGLCLHCGNNSHTTNECRIISKLKCRNCSKSGHVAKVCISSLLNKTKTVKNFQNRSIHYVTQEETNDYQINRIENVYSNSMSHDDRLLIDVQINGNICQFECDSGSKLSIMNIYDFKRLQIKGNVIKTNVLFRSYTGENFKPLGVVNVNVSYGGYSKFEDLYLIELKKDPILGRDWIRNLNINLNEIKKINYSNPIITVNEKPVPVSNIINQFSDVFEQKIGKIPNYVCSLVLREHAKPVFFKSRPVPYALKDLVDAELDKLENDGIITKTNHSEWGTPLVIVPKADGTVRICADFKVTVNNQLHEFRYPIPRIDDIFNKLRGGTYYCTLDVHKAYLHLQVDEESSKIQTISTHRGTYLANRLFFGIKSAPNEFHKFIDQFVQDLDGTIAYFDDIIVQGCSYEECKNRLIKVLEKLRKYDMHLNINKCKFFEEKVEYLGHIISAQGLQKSPGKIQAILDAPRPHNADEIRQFLGMVMYYSKFIYNASTLLAPLNKLLQKKVPFKWTADCEKSFLNIKSQITSDQILVPFDPELPVTLATDASPTGLSGVLSHITPDGNERPIAFASRSLTVSERNYSQLDKEATAVYWACKKFHDYIFGRKFTLIVDNKPMMSILHPDKKLPSLTSSRMLRYANFLSNFDYTIQHRKSTDHLNADYLSRNSIPLSTSDVKLVDAEYIYQETVINQISNDTITDKEIREEISNDKELSQLREDLLNGKVYDPEISLQNGILFRGNRVIIPKSLQPQILKELHSTHIGIVKMKALARSHCYWQKIDSDIENIAKSCKECCDYKKSPKPAPIHFWEKPSKNWQRIHIDYAGPFMNHYFIIVVDAKSKWPEIFASKKTPTTSSTIHYLREIFSRHGLPEIMVSDNASIFKSAEFQEFCKRNGIRQRFIAPGHPSTNGQAERYVQTLKTRLKCMKFHPGTLHEKLYELLFRYRATPLSCGQTPAENLLGQNLRTKLDLLKPQSPGKYKNTIEQPKFGKYFNIGERVQSKNYTNSTLWKYGTIVEKLGRVHYLVELDDGYVIKRHYDQLRPCQVEKQDKFIMKYDPPKKVQFQLPVEENPQTAIAVPANQPGNPNIDSPNKVNHPDSSTAVKKPTTLKNSSFSQSQQLRRSSRMRKPVIRLNL